MTPEGIETLRMERDYWRLVAKDVPKARDAYYNAIRANLDGAEQKAAFWELAEKMEDLRIELVERGVKL